MSNDLRSIDDAPGSVERRSIIATLALALGLADLWALTHHYLGLSRDGELYAMQAVARIHPYFTKDIYLANTSQDAFTIFSPLYAQLIRWMGLPAASCLLFVLCSACFLTAAWILARRFTGVRVAWCAVALLICTISSYGAYGIFESPSDYLSARSLGEALVVVALAAYYSDHRRIAFAVILTAMFVHPLMALPGLLLLLCLTVPLRVAVMAASAGTMGLALLAFAAARGYIASRFVVLMDPAWLEVVRERSQFLFLNYWRLSDWEIQLRPFLCLALTLSCVRDARIKNLCLAAALVGVTGLILTAIGGIHAPLAVLVQGQAWRWCWVTSFVAVLLLAPTALSLWRAGGSGYLCAVMLLAGWTFAPIDGTAIIAGAFFLWLLRSRISSDRDLLLKYAAYALIGIIGAWTAANLLQPWGANTGHVNTGDRVIDWLRGAFTLRSLAVVLFGLLVYVVYRRRAARWAALLAGALLAAAVLPSAIEPATGFAAVQEGEEFADWRAVIPESSSVLLLPAFKNASFLWFALQRTSYLTTSQSAGVVFSPITAAEVRRRSEVLLPVMTPDWRILSDIEASAHGRAPKDRPALSAAGLAQICTDPQLGFVVAKENLGFGALHHTHHGQWQDWNLYDCRRVRADSGP